MYWNLYGFFGWVFFNDKRRSEIFFKKYFYLVSKTPTFECVSHALNFTLSSHLTFFFIHGCFFKISLWTIFNTFFDLDFKEIFLFGWKIWKMKIRRNFTYFPCHDGMPQWYRIGGNLHSPLVALKKVSTNQIFHTDDIHSKLPIKWF